MLMILVIFSLLWGGVSAYALYALNQMTAELTLTRIQQTNGDIINGANGQYFRAMSALDRAVASKRSDNQADNQMEINLVAAQITQLREGLATFKTTDHANIDPATVDNIYNTSSRLFNEAIVPMYAAVKAEHYDEFTRISSHEYHALRTDFTKAINSYNVVVDKLKVHSKERIFSWVEQVKRVLVVALVIGLLIVLLTDRYLAMYVIKPLALMQQHLQILADGKLHVTLAEMGRNCVGKLIPYVQRMQSNWAKTVSDIRLSADDIYRSAGEIAAGNSHLSSRTEEQASALEQTAASMEQLSAVVKQNADNANQASTLAQDASLTANKGGDLVNSVIKTMGSITTSSRKITDIIEVINSIAFQTNILALNAAVEAARAGEQGRGFAVVASEVRNLAQRSAQAAKEIEGLIKDSVSNVQIGSDQVVLAGGAMENIVKAVSNVTDIMAEIASASNEQSKGIDQVGQAVVEMDSVTQQNAALVEQSTAASTSLEDQARRLTQVVAIFQLSDGLMQSA